MTRLKRLNKINQLRRGWWQDCRRNLSFTPWRLKSGMQFWYWGNKSFRSKAKLPE